jgi:sister chromatid cohesion protein DCC1
LTIKGNPDDDAVLCTADKTYALRSVVLSNSVLVVTAPSTSANSPSKHQDVVIRDQLNEIIELVPSVPKLHRLNGLLKGMEYDEGLAEEQLSYDEDERPVSIFLLLRHSVCVTFIIIRQSGRNLPMRTPKQKFKQAILN